MKKADDAKMAKDTPPESDNLFDSFSSQLKTKLDKIISENAGKGVKILNLQIQSITSCTAIDFRFIKV